MGRSLIDSEGLDQVIVSHARGRSNPDDQAQTGQKLPLIDSK
jgi:hypothetical protein